MHEYSLVMSLIERVQSEATQRSAKRVRRISIRVGELCGVEAELLSSAFEIARIGTLCETAALDVKLEPATWTCPKCETRLDPAKSLRCATCDTAGKLAQGGDLLFEQMEIEV
jgi:hydrogenase nickel incorporation protein HypA/HybF